MTFRITRTCLITSTAAIAFASMTASAANESEAQTFATKAAMIGKAEVELGKLALKHSQNEDVRQFAQRMIDDHTAVDAKLKSIAAKEDLQLPGALDAAHQTLKQKLSDLEGKQFDTAYGAEMAKGHEKAVALFESASRNGSLPTDLKQFAASTLPTLKDHKDKAHALLGHNADTDTASR